MLGFFHGWQFLESRVALIATHQIPDWSLVLSQRKTETAILSYHLKKRKKKKKKKNRKQNVYPSMPLVPTSPPKLLLSLSTCKIQAGMDTVAWRVDPVSPLEYDGSVIFQAVVRRCQLRPLVAVSAFFLSEYVNLSPHTTTLSNHFIKLLHICFLG
ncbi:hypothetical protein TorRG33x02_119400 [Trema orientale]|uniref:Uncharacterized protein n=1 Tax=Trema orientale TaxID=63057 RepID=A0A2P5F3E1_TREOI|nr:hypothetical protein TorRG33x02_119400 [Trema orientale]